MSFPESVETELDKARAKHPRQMNSLHEGFAVLLEEVEEFKREVFQGRDDAALKELLQVAAVAQRIAEDCYGDRGSRKIGF